jgi:hypothetical protein
VLAFFAPGHWARDRGVPNTARRRPQGWGAGGWHQAMAGSGFAGGAEGRRGRRQGGEAGEGDWLALRTLLNCLYFQHGTAPGAELALAQPLRALPRGLRRLAGELCFWGLPLTLTMSAAPWGGVKSAGASSPSTTSAAGAEPQDQRDAKQPGEGTPTSAQPGQPPRDTAERVSTGRGGRRWGYLSSFIERRRWRDRWQGTAPPIKTSSTKRRASFSSSALMGWRQGSYRATHESLASVL